MKTVEEYLITLRRLPDDIVLDMATREFEMGEPNRCVCGWAIRAALTKRLGREPSLTEISRAVHDDEPQYFGGTRQEWSDIFIGVCHTEELEKIEYALVLRVDEAVEAACGTR